MNPPYKRNLHLKILAEVIKHLKDDESVCVNLSPILWLENPLAEYKLKSDYYRFKDLRMHIKEVNVVDVNSANESFNIGLFCDLGVYVASKKENCEYTNVEILKQCLGKNYFILRKVLNTKTDKVSNHIKKGFNGICVKVATVRGFGSGNNFDIVSLCLNCHESMLHLKCCLIKYLHGNLLFYLSFHQSSSQLLTLVLQLLQPF